MYHVNQTKLKRQSGGTNKKRGLTAVLKDSSTLHSPWKTELGKNNFSALLTRLFNDVVSWLIQCVLMSMATMLISPTFLFCLSSSLENNYSITMALEVYSNKFSQKYFQTVIVWDFTPMSWHMNSVMSC